MPTVIDSLIIQLDLDPSNFSKGQKQAAADFLKTKEQAAKQAKEIEAAGKRAAEFFSRLRTEALAFFAAFAVGTGLKDFIADITASETATGRLARTLDITGQALGAWQGAIRVFGGSGADIAGTLQTLTQSLQRITTFGDAAIVGPLARLGISAFDARNHLKSASDILFELNDRVQGMDPARASAFMSAMGIDRNTQYMVLQSRDAFRQLYDEELKLAPTAADIEAAMQRQKSWTLLDQTLTHIGQTILTDVSPAIVEVLNEMRSWVGQNEAWIKTDFEVAIKSLGTTLKSINWSDVTRGAKAFGDGLKTIADNSSAIYHFLTDPVDMNWIGKYLFGIDTKKNPVRGPDDLLGLGWIDDKVNRWEKRGAFGSSIGLRAGAGASASGGWWTADRQKHAVDVLTAGGLSKLGAEALVSRWKNVESAGGPGSVNPSSGAFGIGQWLGDRRAGIAGNTDFDAQLAYVLKELGSTESRAGALLRSAANPWDAARGASAYERAEGFDWKSLTDLYTARVSGGIPAVDATTAAAAARISHDNSRKTNVDSETHIGHITIQTQATDAAGISKDLKQSIDKYSFVNLANYGPQG